jgi:hypothetical protein
VLAAALRDDLTLTTAAAVDNLRRTRMKSLAFASLRSVEAVFCLPGLRLRILVLLLVLIPLGGQVI